MSSQNEMNSKFQIFESTQVALNINYLSLMPESINKSSFFIELAEYADLTFCEQIDNGCPVFLGLWNNILNAEKKLEEFVKSWEVESSPVECRPASQTVTIVDDRTGYQSDTVTTEAQLECVVTDPLVFEPPGCTIEVPRSCEPSTVASSSPSQLYVVTSEEDPPSHQSQLMCYTIASVNDIENSICNKLILDTSRTRPDIKEIFVDIAVSPLKNSPSKSTTTDQHLDLNSSSNQNPLDKLCQLLCINEDETLEKRKLEVEKRKKMEEKLPYKYFCDQCSFKAKRENHIIKHLKLHETMKKIFCCDQCDFKTIREGVLCRHKLQHSSTQLNCKLCPYRTYSAKYLSKHVQVIHNAVTRTKPHCSYCDFTAPTKRDIYKHLKLFHKPDKKPVFWKCSKCPYKSKLRPHLTRHENDIHGGLRPFLCHYCGKRFKRNDTLTQHKVLHGEVKKTFTCQHCGKVCTSAVIFTQHLASHSTERPFLCDVCGRSFKTKGATARHKRNMHSSDSRRLTCSRCSVSFMTYSELNRHRKSKRCKAEATTVPAVMTGANVQESYDAPITIQIVYAETLSSNNQDVSIK